MPLLFLTLSIFAILVLPQLVEGGGMFFDGVTYSAIARNLAEGVGTFWSPHYTETTYPAFYEHPPLGFAVQSVIYRLLGDAFYVDVLWGIFLGALTLAGIGFSWWRSNGRAGLWWPMLLWLAYPLATWAIKNNALENIVVIFVLGSALLVDEAFRGRAVWSLGAGALTAAAFFTKGPVGLFVLAAPFFHYCFIDRNARKAARVTFGMIGGGLLFAAILFLPQWETAVAAIQAYGNQQVVKSLRGMRELSPSRFYLLKRLFSESLSPLLIAAALSLRAGALPKNPRAHYFLALGLAGSLPLLISPKQMGWYLVPSLPFFALAIAELFKNTSYFLEEKLSPRIQVSVASLLCLVTLIGLATGPKGLGRDPEMYSDLVHQDLALPPRSLVEICPADLMSHWSLIAVLQRFRRVSLTTEKSEYRLHPVGANCPLPDNCRPLQSHPPRAYALFHCP